ncbi:MAG: DUF4330 domain-containing protein [Clostridiales bacterium]|nr:DUF4330 domain-containing protein [Clostridiales bacterium]
MILDNRGRVLGKVSIIDIFVVVVLISVFAVAYLKFGNNSKSAVREPEQAVRITFYKEALEDFTVSSIEEGAPVVNDTNGTFMGNIEEIIVGESINYLPDINGAEQPSVMEGYSSVAIVTEVNGRMSEGALLLNGNLYGSGSKCIIWAGKAKIQLMIKDIEVL